MTDTVRCPDCGQENAPGITACTRCGFPLVAQGASGVPEAGSSGDPSPVRTDDAPAPAAAAPGSTPAPSRAAAPIKPFRLTRPRRPEPKQGLVLTLWLTFGILCAIVVVGVAVKGFHDNNFVPIPGSNSNQQQRADSLRSVLAKDSTDVRAHVLLADILYDTANWPEAIVHYRAAVARDSTLVTALVDLGVCYYNLAEPAQAEKHFELALRRDPHQPVALFNLGIVHEQRDDAAGALQYFHRALQSDPPEGMKQPLLEAMQRAQKKAGVVAPPLPK
jgi:tetratricopeptide (TPR) repeat protein